MTAISIFFGSCLRGCISCHRSKTDPLVCKARCTYFKGGLHGTSSRPGFRVFVDSTCILPIFSGGEECRASHFMPMSPRIHKLSVFCSVPALPPAPQGTWVRTSRTQVQTGVQAHREPVSSAASFLTLPPAHPAKATPPPHLWPCSAAVIDVRWHLI